VNLETQTKIKLISDALILLGEKPLQSLADDRYGATVGANLFDLIYENELQSNRWRFSVNKRALARLVEAPLNQWQYAYQLPSDMLLPLHVYPPTPYEIYGDRIYTDATAVELDYVFKPDIEELPAYFSLLLVYALAKNLQKPITAEDVNEQKMLQMKYNMQRDRAMYADAQGRPATAVADSPFTDVRFSTG
jgi:hypothetical protein